MTNKDLCEISKNSKNIILKVKDSSFIQNMDSYGEKGMFCILKEITIDKDQDIKLIVDWLYFEETNIPLETESWVIPGSGGAHTMKAAGAFPANGLETLFLPGEEESSFELAGDSKFVYLYLEYKLLNLDISFIEWTQDIAFIALKKDL